VTSDIVATAYVFAATPITDAAFASLPARNEHAVDGPATYTLARVRETTASWYAAATPITDDARPWPLQSAVIVVSGPTAMSEAFVTFKTVGGNTEKDRRCSVEAAKPAAAAPSSLEAFRLTPPTAATAT
jgi:hypothetical protein